VFLQDVDRWRIIGDVAELSVAIKSVQKKRKLDTQIFVIDIVRDNQLCQVEVLKQGLSRLEIIQQICICL